MQKTKRRSYCPISLALDIIGDRWTLIVIRDLLIGKSSYREFLESDERIATNILADRLCLLESQKLVTKSPDPSHKSKFIYRLTRKGSDLFPVLIALAKWSSSYEKRTEIDKRLLKKARIKIKF